jgi:hypothetical protein
MSPKPVRSVGRRAAGHDTILPLLPVGLAVTLGLIAASAAGSSEWVRPASERPSAGALSWDSTADMHRFYLESFPVGAGGGSAVHTIGEVPWLQTVDAGDELYEIDAVQLIGLRSLGLPAVYPSTRLDRLGWRPLTPVETDGLARLLAGEEVIEYLTEDRPRVIGAVRNEGGCTSCHGTGNGELLGVLSYLLKRPDDHLADYEELVDDLEAGRGASFVALRWAFTRWEGYHPRMSAKFGRHCLEIFKAGRRKKYDWVVDHCDEALQHSYVDVTTHALCAQAHSALGDAERAGFHSRVASGLLASLLASGDGTEEYPYIAVTYREIEALLGFEGSRSLESERVDADGNSYQLHRVTDRSGKHRTVWFQTTVMDEWISQDNR